MGLLAGMGDVAADLARVPGGIAEVGHGRPWPVALLFGQPAVVNAASVDAWRGAGLQPCHAQR